MCPIRDGLTEQISKGVFSGATAFIIHRDQINFRFNARIFTLFSRRIRRAGESKERKKDVAREN